MPIPNWALLLSFWLHMMATVVWVGGLAALALFVLPALRRTLKPNEFATWLTALNKRWDPLGWFCLGLLTFTGLIQMDANPSYIGLLAVTNPWSQAIFLKHITFAGMIAVSAYSTWVIAPSLQRAAISRTRGKGTANNRTLGSLQSLIQINFFLGILILVFTALARIN